VRYHGPSVNFPRRILNMMHVRSLYSHVAIFILTCRYSKYYYERLNIPLSKKDIRRSYEQKETYEQKEMTLLLIITYSLWRLVVLADGHS
jgi:hypothetical protein